ncbi:MAG: hypothetical protein Q4D57_00145 [Clostridia bacterium]|nr:hypothetical protein [Clostridia bacterium]
MATPKPLRESYKIAQNTKKEIKDTVRPLVIYAIRGDQKFLINLIKINWNSLSAKNVFDVILLMLSYGLTKQKQAFERYIKQENMNGNVSLFTLMRNYDGVRIKNVLNTGSFREIFSSILREANPDINWEKELEKLLMRISKISKKDIKPEESAELEALIETIISGRSILPVYAPEEEIE